MPSPYGLMLVDCLTQLICTWIFISSMTKLKEHSREMCYFDALVCPRPNEQFVLGGEGGVRTLARLVCALFSSTWQCQKTSKQGFPFTNLRIEYLMHKLIAGRIQTFFLISYVMATIKKGKIGSKISATWCPFDRKGGEGEVGQTLFGQCQNTQ